MKIRFANGTWTHFDNVSRGEQDRVRICVLTDVRMRLATGLSPHDLLDQVFKTEMPMKMDGFPGMRYWIMYRPLRWTEVEGKED